MSLRVLLLTHPPPRLLPCCCRLCLLCSPPLQQLLTCPGTAVLGRGLASLPAAVAHQMGAVQALMHLASEAVRAACDSPFLDGALENASGGWAWEEAAELDSGAGWWRGCCWEGPAPGSCCVEAAGPRSGIGCACRRACQCAGGLTAASLAALLMLLCVQRCCAR